MKYPLSTCAELDFTARQKTQIGATASYNLIPNSILEVRETERQPGALEALNWDSCLLLREMGRWLPYQGSLKKKKTPQMKN